MDPDQEVCICFHVTLRKLLQHLRVCKPVRASQLSECYGAGTGCGWCRPVLEAMFATTNEEVYDALPDAVAYAQAREVYLDQQARNPQPTTPDRATGVKP
jgi:bacterioferritin-associated ferredoxin